MSNEIQLISDGNGLAIIGEPSVVESFLSSEGLPSRDLGLKRLGSLLSRGANFTQAGSQIAADSGRWVQMTKKSAELVKKYDLMTNKKTGLKMGVIQDTGQTGKIKGHVQFVKGTKSLATNPAVLTGVAGLLTQLAMQQTMDEVTDYLARIDEKLDDVLRTQKDSVLANIIGADLVIGEALAVRDEVNRVSEVTWSKVDSTATTIASTQAYALRQLDALMQKIDQKAAIGDKAKAANEVAASVREWLAVLARCSQLQDAVWVLELDRMLDSMPEDLEDHRRGIHKTRQSRLELISSSTLKLVELMSETAAFANTKVLLHPIAARIIVHSSNEVAVSVVEFHSSLGIDKEQQLLAAKRWSQAASEAVAKALETGSVGVGAARKAGVDVFESVTGRFRSDDADHDGNPEPSRARAAIENAGEAIKNTRATAAEAVGYLFRPKETEDEEPQEIDSKDQIALEREPRFDIGNEG